MRTITGPAADVTYIGPRAFAIGFMLVCAAFVALFVGLDRFTESSEVSPISVESAQAIGIDRLSAPASAQHAPTGAQSHDAPQALGRMTPVISPAPVAPADRSAWAQSTPQAPPLTMVEAPLVPTRPVVSSQPVVALQPVVATQAAAAAQPMVSRQSVTAQQPFARLSLRHTGIATQRLSSLQVHAAAKPVAPALRFSAATKPVAALRSRAVAKPIPALHDRRVTNVGALRMPPAATKPVLPAKPVTKHATPLWLPPPTIARASSPPLLVPFTPAKANRQLDPRFGAHQTLLIAPARSAFATAAVAPAPQPVAP